MNFFRWAIAHLVVGSREVKNDLSDQYNVSLGVCNVKIRKFLTGAKQGSFSRCFGLRDHTGRGIRIFFRGINADVKSSCCENILANT